MLGAEPVRAKKADVWMSGDSDVLLFAKRNPWAHVFDPDKPIDKRPNTWAVRYGDPEWKHFLDFWRVHGGERRDGAPVQAPHGEARRGVSRSFPIAFRCEDARPKRRATLPLSE